MLAGKVSWLGACLVLSQNSNDLLFREPLPLHRPSPSLGPDSKSIWRKSSVAGHRRLTQRLWTAMAKLSRCPKQRMIHLATSFTSKKRSTQQLLRRQVLSPAAREVQLKMQVVQGVLRGAGPVRLVAVSGIPSSRFSVYNQRGLQTMETILCLDKT